jgi:ATP-binding cassette subfamily C protein LapB
VQDINFSYEGQTTEALSGVSFSIASGEKVAVVGRVGSGKSTLGKLLSRLYDASSGKVLIGDIDIKQIDPSELRENIGYVSQEPWLIAGSIEENITLGNPYISSEDVLWAAKISGVSSFADKHPQGFKLQVKERGEGLSGGQKQCIAVARAIVRRPPILILDEPTSSMDARTEKSFLEAFSKHDSGSTLIIITHRTSLISMVDKVLVMDNGKLIGAGPSSQFLGVKTEALPQAKVEN